VERSLETRQLSLPEKLGMLRRNGTFLWQKGFQKDDRKPCLRQKAHTQLRYGMFHSPEAQKADRVRNKDKGRRTSQYLSEKTPAVAGSTEQRRRRLPNGSPNPLYLAACPTLQKPQRKTGIAHECNRQLKPPLMPTVIASKTCLVAEPPKRTLKPKPQTLQLTLLRRICRQFPGSMILPMLILARSARIASRIAFSTFSLAAVQ
jgi:hypothetical protein